MKVNNINGTRANTCKCGSWLAHWQKFSGYALPKYCPKMMCRNNPEEGAHVQKDSATDKSWYIIPLCSTHNAEIGKSLTISDYITLVPANVSITCEKNYF